MQASYIANFVAKTFVEEYFNIHSTTKYIGYLAITTTIDTGVTQLQLLKAIICILNCLYNKLDISSILKDTSKFSRTDYPNNQQIYIKYDVSHAGHLKTLDSCKDFYIDYLNLVNITIQLFTLKNQKFGLTIDLLLVLLYKYLSKEISKKGGKVYRKNTFESMTVADLKQRCIKRNIKGYSSMRKAELIAALRK